MTKLETILFSSPGLIFGSHKYGTDELTCESRIAQAVYSAVAARDCIYACPNVYSVKGVIECDLLTVSKKHRAYEWEIKRSRQDFLKDREKEQKRLWYRLTLETGKPVSRGRSAFIPNRYYMVLDGVWLKDEDWEHIPSYASVYIIQQKEITWDILNLDTTNRRIVTLHLVKRGKDLHKHPLQREVIDDLHKRLSYRLMGNPNHQQATKHTYDCYEI